MIGIIAGEGNLPKVLIKKLSDKKLEKYASAFDITINELKNFNPS